MNAETTTERQAVAERPADTLPAAAETTLKGLVLSSYSAIEGHMTTLAARHRGVAFDCTTTKGLKEAKAARHELRENGIYAAQRLRDRLKGEVNAIKKDIESESERLIAIVKPVEQAIDEQIAAEEQRKADEKAKREAEEAARLAEIERKAQERRDWIAAGLATIERYATRCQAPDMTAARIATGIAALRAVEFGPEWGDDFGAAEQARGEALATMERLQLQAQAREDEAARVEAQRVENERVAAELAEKQRKVDEQLAELERQRLAALPPPAPPAPEPESAPAAPLSIKPIPTADNRPIDITGADHFVTIAPVLSGRCQYAAPAGLYPAAAPAPTFASLAAMVAAGTDLEPSAPAVRQEDSPAYTVPDAPREPLSALQSWLGMPVTADILTGFGFGFVQVKQAKTYAKSDFRKIAARLAEHFAALAK